MEVKYLQKLEKSSYFIFSPLKTFCGLINKKKGKEKNKGKKKKAGKATGGGYPGLRVFELDREGSKEAN